MQRLSPKKLHLSYISLRRGVIRISEPTVGIALGISVFLANRTSIYAFLKGIVSAVKPLVKITPMLF